MDCYSHCRDHENGHGGHVHDHVRHDDPSDRASGNVSRRYEHENVSVNLRVNGHDYAHGRDRDCDRDRGYGCGRGHDHGRDDDGQKLPYQRGSLSNPGC